MPKPIKAIAVFTNSEINGTVTFTEIITEINNIIRIDVNITGLRNVIDACVKSDVLLNFISSSHKCSTTTF